MNVAANKDRIDCSEYLSDVEADKTTDMGRGVLDVHNPAVQQSPTAVALQRSSSHPRFVGGRVEQLTGSTGARPDVHRIVVTVGASRDN